MEDSELIETSLGIVYVLTCSVRIPDHRVPQSDAQSELLSGSVEGE